MHRCLYLRSWSTVLQGAWWITRGHHPANKSHHTLDTSIRTVSLWCECLLLSEVKNSEYSDCSLLTLWKNNRSSLAGEMLQNHLLTATTSPFVRKKVNSYILASVQTGKYAGILCPSRSRGSLRESSSVASQMRLPLWRQRAGAINSARVRFHSGKQGASYKQEHQPASRSSFSLEHKAERVRLI